MQALSTYCDAFDAQEPGNYVSRTITLTFNIEH